MDVYVAPISWGLGDAVVSLPVLQYFIDRGDQTFLIVRSALQSDIGDRIAGLAGTIEESERQSIVFDGTEKRFINLREHPIQTEYWWGSSEFEEAFPGCKINDILEVICRDKGFRPSFAKLTAFSHSKSDGLNHTVVFVPGSDGTHKQWHAAGWLRLSELLNSQGLDTMVLGEPKTNAAVQELIDNGLTWRPTGTIGDAIDVISSCAAVVGVDTGLTHIAVQQGIPTVTLYKKHSLYYRPYAHALAVEAGPCDPVCNQTFLSRAINKVTDFSPDFTHNPWSCEVLESERCMNSISAEVVLARFVTLFWK